MHTFKTARGREPVVSRGQIQPGFGLATRDYSEPAVLCSKGTMLKHLFSRGTWMQVCLANGPVPAPAFWRNW